MSASVGVWNPVVPVAETRRAIVAVLVVELRPQRVVAHLAGLPPDLTCHQLESYRDRLDWWAEARRTRQGAAGPPGLPGAQLLGPQLDLDLSDDCATRYEPKLHSAGGSGSEGRDTWIWSPGVPTRAHRVTLRAAGDHVTASVPLELHLQ